MKSLTEDASLGISQASVVESDDKLRERVAFIHESLGTSAIVERYIEGRELYVGVVGNRRLRVFPVWELRMEGLPDEARPIATQRLKWSRPYQKKYGIRWGEARGPPEPGRPEGPGPGQARSTARSASADSARIDFRLDASQGTYALEANPNPEIAYGEELAESAEKAAGLSYEGLPPADPEPRTPLAPRRLRLEDADGRPAPERADDRPAIRRVHEEGVRTCRRGGPRGRASQIAARRRCPSSL